MIPVAVNGSRLRECLGSVTRCRIKPVPIGGPHHMKKRIALREFQDAKVLSFRMIANKPSTRQHFVYRLQGIERGSTRVTRALTRNAAIEGYVLVLWILRRAVINHPFTLADHRPPVYAVKGSGSSQEAQITLEIVGLLRKRICQLAAYSSFTPSHMTTHQPLDAIGFGNTTQQGGLLNHIVFDKRSKPTAKNLVVIGFGLGSPLCKQIVRVDLRQHAGPLRECQKPNIVDGLEVGHVWSRNRYRMRPCLFIRDRPCRLKCR